MFGGATSFNQPLNAWTLSTTSNVSLFGMFQYSAFNQPLDRWVTTSVTNMANLFQSTSFNQDISMWDTGRVTTMKQMFQWEDGLLETPQVFPVTFNQNISNWNTASVTDMALMFDNNPTFNHSLSSWNIENVTDMTDMFKNAGLSQSNQDATLQSWASQSVQNNVPFHLGLKTYTNTGVLALQTLEDTYNWDITEQYQATYYPGENASLLGDNIQSPLDTGATTTEVTLSPQSNCSFIQWSDGNTDNPRQDVLTDNLTVTAEVGCTTYSTSARTQVTKATEFGNAEQAELIEERFLHTTSTPAYTPPATLEASLEEVSELPNTIEAILEQDSSPETVTILINLLLELIELLTKLMGQVEEGRVG
jgi:surface protein